MTGKYSKLTIIILLISVNKIIQFIYASFEKLRVKNERVKEYKVQEIFNYRLYLEKRILIYPIIFPKFICRMNWYQDQDSKRVQSLYNTWLEAYYWNSFAYLIIQWPIILALQTVWKKMSLNFLSVKLFRKFNVNMSIYYNFKVPENRNWIQKRI